MPQNWLRFGLAIIIAGSSFSFNASAQMAPVKQWDKTIGGSDIDNFSSVQQTTDGGYIIGGTSYSNISGLKSQNSYNSNDFWIIKLDANGNKQWDKTIGGSASDLLRTVQQTSDGGYILGGSSSSGISGDRTSSSKGNLDYWIVKLDQNGNKLWDRAFGGSNFNHFRCLQQTADGGYILGGYSDSPVSGDKTQASQGVSDFWVLKLDGNGNKLWDKTFGGAGLDYLRDLKQTSWGLHTRRLFCFGSWW